MITVEIDEGRYEETVENFKAVGLSDFIDARLADSHELVPELEGPFDFVFIDADKNWYTNYAKAVLPKLEKGGCITAHNIYDSSGRFHYRDFVFGIAKNSEEFGAKSKTKFLIKAQF